MEFDKRVALVTGGSSGIGLETARLLAERGTYVWLLARHRDRLESALACVKDACRSQEQQCGIVIADVADANEVTTAIAEVTDKCGAPDIVINSAGAVYPAAFQDADMSTLRWLMEVNYLGTVNVVHTCLPSMLARRSGYIVNISSVYGFMGGHGYSAYCASKFAVRGFTDALRAELKPLGIGVSLVFPQNTNTPQLVAEEKLKPAIAKALDNTPAISPQAVAKEIVRGMNRGQYVILAGAEAKLLFWLTGFLGTGTYWVMDRMVARAQKKIQRTPGR